MTRIVTMCAGDSNVMGADLRGGFRRPLNNAAPNLSLVGSLCVIGPDYTVGQHEGTPGATVNDCRLLALPQVAVFSPTVILLGPVGTNDITAGTPLDTIVADLKLLAQQFKAAAGVEKVCVTGIPPRNTGAPFDANTTQFNARLEAAMVNPGALGIFYFNMCAATSIADLAGDGLHYTEAGYAKLVPGALTLLGLAGVAPLARVGSSTAGAYTR